jgi:hypothetical protein
VARPHADAARPALNSGSVSRDGIALCLGPAAVAFVVLLPIDFIPFRLLGLIENQPKQSRKDARLRFVAPFGRSSPAVRSGATKP